MSEYELVQIVENAAAQLVVLLGQIIAINFAMIVAIYYFLGRAGLVLKLCAAFLYTLGTLMFLLLAVRESNVSAAAAQALEAQPRAALSPVTRAMIDFGDSPIALIMNIAINLSFWALWVGVFFLLFFWKRKGEPGAPGKTPRRKPGRYAAPD